MATLCGVNGKLVIGTHEVAECNAWTLDIAQEITTTPKFGDTGLTQKVCGPYTWSGTVNCYWMMDDGPGQRSLSDACTGGTTVSAKFYVDDADYYSGSIYISGVNIATAAEPGTIVTVAFTYTSAGDLTLTRA